MSDYIYSSKTQADGFLTGALKDIYLTNPPAANEFRGPWGTLAVTQGHYHGFRPYENDQHLMVVIGGPVLYFRDNDFLVEEDSSAATESIYKRWVVEGNIQWDEDLSGPFTILLIDKQDKAVTVITDLMAFIPVYSCAKAGEIYLGTHVDALANSAGEQSSFDQVSLADFVLNDIITYPYTAYENLRQLPPSSEVAYSGPADLRGDTSYWEPKEINPYKNIQDAAEALREGIVGYVRRVTGKMTSVAQFISGGEDSRALSGMLPAGLKRDAFIFLDVMNREGDIAQKVAKAYDISLSVGYRSDTHYLDILEESSRLVGSGHQYFHAHSLKFDKQFKLINYPAVFGGYLSDSLLKSAYAHKLRGSVRFPFLPQIQRSGETQTKPRKSKIISREVLEELNLRRSRRFEAVRAERPTTSHEWFVLRPATMRTTIPNLYSTRRLFRSYEPFMCKQAVKISASVPTAWKLNRRLFNRAMKPYLKKSKWILHADGRYPYFPWWLNSTLQFGIWCYRQAASRSGFITGNQGPWGDWEANLNSSRWQEMLREVEMGRGEYAFLSDDAKIRVALESETLTVYQKINLMQVAYCLGK